MDFSKPTQSSVASRFPALKSRGTCRGFVVYQNRVVVFESHLELIAFFLLSLLPTTATIFDQPTAVDYRDGEARHRHTFDFLVINHDGKRAMIAVKPAVQVRKSGINRILRLIAEQIPAGIADSVHLITDADFTYADRYNATQAFDCSRFPNVEHDNAVNLLMAELVGAVRIVDIVNASGLGGMAFRAVIRLITSGVLVPVKPRERITPDSLVIRKLSPAAPGLMSS
ncbi:hypothetical protein [Bradyrhizobium sp. SZCCHNR3107]|uniref:hypothetical protein n=1 Tax=Bradyrhizobium sp. SZCCHNR3107 TaxID=3057459 RepID=UPI0028F061A7|nr:hypothetical protein [Bradyrhizobium sp. SZCCHNR3107]